MKCKYCGNDMNHLENSCWLWCPACGTIQQGASWIMTDDKITADRDRWKERCIKLLESHKDLVAEGMSLYAYYPNSHRKTAREYFAEEIKLQEMIEKEAGDENTG